MPPPKMKHIMLDLETFGKGTDGAIVSIGAVLFDPNQDKVSVDSKEQFYYNIDLTKSKWPGVIDADTIEWWMIQDQEARLALNAAPKEPLEQVLAHFNTWIINMGMPPKDDTWRLWSNPPTFDEELLRDAYTRHGWDFIMHYRTTRCMRTLCNLGDELGIRIPEIKNELKHHALYDAIYQAKVVCAFYQGLRKAII